MRWAEHTAHMVYMAIKPERKNWPRENQTHVQNFRTNLKYRKPDITAKCFVIWSILYTQVFYISEKHMHRLLIHLLPT